MDDRQCLGAIPGITKITDTGDKNFKELQLTPWGVAKEQIDMLPEEIFNPQSMFVDICYKNEVYLHAIRERLMKSRYMNVPGLDNLENRLIYITRMQLYAICPLELTYKMCKAWFSSVKWPHAYIPDKHILKAYGSEYRNPLEALDALRSCINGDTYEYFTEKELYEFMIDTVNMRENKMKFDVVVGNPPYNNDMYLDFVTKSHALASKYTCMITPAKWQAKGGEKNEAFRRDIVPYMEKIVYYKDASNFFNISLSGGISLYSITKNTHSDKIINGKCIQGFDASLPLDITDTELRILNKIKKDASIINRPKFCECKGYFISILPTVIEQGSGINNIDTSSDIYLTDCTGRKIPISKERVRNLDDAYKYKLGISLHTFENTGYTSHIWEPNYILGRNELILYVGTEEECRYADSYFGSKLVYWLSKRFFGSQTASTLSFKFVPDPGAFDHIFTDKELYKKYNLTSDEIAVIESVIKEHK